MLRSSFRVGLSIVFALVVTSCGGASDDEPETAATTEAVEDSVVAEATTTTGPPETTTTKPPKTTTTAETTTTEATTTTAVEVADDAAVADYCTALDEIDAFLEADFPAEEDLPAAIDEQQRLISAMVPPADSLTTAHESFAGAFLEFYDLLESNNFDVSDAEIDEIFSAIDVNLAERIIENYRETNCDGFEASDDDPLIVSGQFDFEQDQCINEDASGDFEDVACNEPHDYQIYSLFDVDDADEYPGEGSLSDIAEARCIEAFEPYIGASFNSSIYYVTTLRPSSASWAFGDREIVCLVQAETGQLTKDVKGAAE